MWLLDISLSLCHGFFNKAKKLVFVLLFGMIQKLKITGLVWNNFILKFSVADPYPGSGAFLTPGSRIRNRFFPDPGTRIPNPYFFESWMKFFWVRSSIILCKLAQSFFFHLLKNNFFFNFVIFVATKKGTTTNLFIPSLLLLFLDPGSVIRDKHPGSAKLLKLYTILPLQDLKSTAKRSSQRRRTPNRHYMALVVCRYQLTEARWKGGSDGRECYCECVTALAANFLCIQKNH